MKPEMTLPEALAVICVMGSLGYPTPSQRYALSTARNVVHAASFQVSKRFVWNPNPAA